jgi:hypothetical protein
VIIFLKDDHGFLLGQQIFAKQSNVFLNFWLWELLIDPDDVYLTSGRSGRGRSGAPFKTSRRRDKLANQSRFMPSSHSGSRRFGHRNQTLKYPRVFILSVCFWVVRNNTVFYLFIFLISSRNPPCLWIFEVHPQIKRLFSVNWWLCVHVTLCNIFTTLALHWLFLGGFHWKFLKNISEKNIERDSSQHPYWTLEAEFLFMDSCLGIAFNEAVQSHSSTARCSLVLYTWDRQSSCFVLFPEGPLALSSSESAKSCNGMVE